MPLPKGSTSELQIQHIRILGVGGPGTGKSAMAGTMPKPWIADPELGMENYKRVKARPDATDQLVVKPYYTWLEFQRDIHAMQKDGTLERFTEETGCESIVVDSITKLNYLLTQTFDDVTGKLDESLSAEDKLFGRTRDVQEWGRIKAPVQRCLTDLDQARCHKLYIAHSAAKFVKQYKNGRMVMVPGEGVVPKGGNDYLHNVDIIIVFLSLDDPNNPEHKPGMGYIQKDRTQTFKVGQIVPNISFNHFKPFLESGRKLAPETTTTFMPQNSSSSKPDAIQTCMENAVVKQLAEKIGLTDDQLRAGVEARNGDLNAVIEALKAKVQS